MCFGEKFTGVRRRRQDRISEGALSPHPGNDICFQTMFTMFSNGGFTLEIKQEYSSCPFLCMISVQKPKHWVEITQVSSGLMEKSLQKSFLFMLNSPAAEVAFVQNKNCHHSCASIQINNMLPFFSPWDEDSGC